jgi:hypothetical protein
MRNSHIKLVVDERLMSLSRLGLICSCVVVRIYLPINFLLTAFETPDVEHEQQWVKFVMLAYVQPIVHPSFASTFSKVQY